MSNTLCLLLAVFPAAPATAKSPEYAAGSIVLVTNDAAPLMDANQTVTTVKRGRWLQITEVRDPWLKTKVYVGDKARGAWILKSNVRPYDVATDFSNRASEGDAQYKARLDSLTGSNRKLLKTIKIAEIDAWRASLLKVLDSDDAESLLTPEAFMLLLPTVDSLFHADNKYKRASVAVLHARTRQLSKDDLEAWRPVLQQASGEPVLNFHVAMLLVQQDRLFHLRGFDSELSGLWRERLKTLPMPELLEWSQRTRKPPHRAALDLVQNDSLFDGGQFQPSAFEEHLRNHRLLSGG